MNKINKQPLVSVVMPVKNGERFVAEAVQSILNQSYKNIELIVVNDGSTDKTELILKKLIGSFPDKIKLLKVGESGGAYRAMNLGYLESKGKYIAVMDSDDLAYTNRLELQVEFLENNPKVGVVGGWVDIIDADGEVIGEKILPVDHESIYRAFGSIHPMVHPALMIRKSILNQKFIYECRYGVNDDYATMLALISHVRFANLPTKILGYRVHGKNSSLTNFKKLAWNTIRIRLQAIFSGKYSITFLAAGILMGQILIASILPNGVLSKLYWLRLKLKKIEWQMTSVRVRYATITSGFLVFLGVKNR